MNTMQIAHDLAIAKLYGSNLTIQELCEKYDQYYQEILAYLNSKNSDLAKCEVPDKPIY